MRRVIIALAFAGTFLPSLRSETPYPPLKTMVELSDLIVRCRVEVKNRSVGYHVLETWKGKYSPDLFYENTWLRYSRPPNGYVRIRTFPVKEPLPPNGQEVVLFYSFHGQPQWTMGKLLFDFHQSEVKSAKIVYPNDSYPPRPVVRDRQDYATEEAYQAALAKQSAWDMDYGIREEYTLPEFKKAVLDAAAIKKEPVKGSKP